MSDATGATDTTCRDPADPGATGGSSAGAATSAATASVPPRRRRWLRRLAVLSVIAVLLVVFHVPILRGVARFLIVEDELEKADAVLILGGEKRFDEAARLLHEGWAGRVMVIEERPTRLVALGVVPPERARALRELTARGVPAEALDVLADSGFRTWNQARRLRDWMAGHPQARLVVLHDRLFGRALRNIYESVLPADAFARLRWRGLPEEDFDESNWWRHRKGVPRMLSHYLGLVYEGLFGEDEDWRIWNPDEYARTLPQPAP